MQTSLPQSAQLVALRSSQSPLEQSIQLISPPSSTTHTQPSGHLWHFRTTPPHTPFTHTPVWHWLSSLHFLPAGLGCGAAPAIPGMDASVPPMRAAPINLSA